MHDDERLIERIVFGSDLEQESAWRDLMDRFRGPLVSAARRAVRHRADECVDEFFQHVCSYAKLGAFLRRRDRSVALGPYLKRAVVNFARREYLRAVGANPGHGDESEDAGRPPEGVAETTTPVDTLIRDEIGASIREAARRLPPMRRVCFLLRHRGELGLELDKADLAWLAKRTGSGPDELLSATDPGRKASAQELASVLGIGPDAFYQHIRRALVSIRTSVGSQGGAR